MTSWTSVSVPVRGFLLLLLDEMTPLLTGETYKVSVPVRGFLLLLLQLDSLFWQSNHRVSVPVRGFLLLLLEIEARLADEEHGFSPREGIFAFATGTFRYRGKTYTKHGFSPREGIFAFATRLRRPQHRCRRAQFQSP